MNRSMACRRRLHFEKLEGRAMPAAQALATLSNTAGLAADPGSTRVEAVEALTVSSAVSGGGRAAAALLTTPNGSSNVNVSPVSNNNGLTTVVVSAASSAAIEAQSILDSPGSFIASAIQDASNLDSFVFILDPSLISQVAATTATIVASGDTAILSTDLFFAMFNDLNNSV